MMMNNKDYNRADVLFSTIQSILLFSADALLGDKDSMKPVYCALRSSFSATAVGIRLPETIRWQCRELLVSADDIIFRAQYNTDISSEARSPFTEAALDLNSFILLKYIYS